jgi:glycosyltransferase involved in cell wall biosynthesis
VINILQVNKFYYPHIGGVEKVVQQLSEEFLKDPGVSNEVLACHTEKHDRQTIIRGVHATLAGSYRTVLGMPISTSFPKLLAKLSKGKDIVDFHMPFPLAAWCLNKITSRSTRVVVHYHADVVRQRKLKWAYEPAFRKLLDRADAVVVSSPNLRNRSEILKDYRDKCHVIPFMMSLPSVGKVSADQVAMLKRDIGLPQIVPVVLYVGRFVYYKGLEYLIEAMVGVPDAVLLMVGDGPLKAQLSALATTLGIEKRVFWRSGVSDEDLAAYYALGDLFAFPSSATTEAYGIVQMEALASGLPVVNTDLPTGVPWVSRHDESGITVPPCNAKALRDAIGNILSDSELLAKYKDGALKRAEDFKPDAVRQATMKLYRGLLAI